MSSKPLSKEKAVDRITRCIGPDPLAIKHAIGWVNETCDIYTPWKVSAKSSPEYRGCIELSYSGPDGAADVIIGPSGYLECHARFEADAVDVTSLIPTEIVKGIVGITGKYPAA